MQGEALVFFQWISHDLRFPVTFKQSEHQKQNKKIKFTNWIQNHNNWTKNENTPIDPFKTVRIGSWC